MQFPSETTVSFQSVYYNDAASSNQQSIYMKSQQVKQSGELREKEREKEISRLTGREAEHWAEMEVAWVRNGRYRN